MIDRTPSSILKDKTPYEILLKASPSYDHLRVFGCLCYAYKHQRPKDKFESRSRKCIFIGYPHAKKGWKLYDIETGVVFISRDVVFDETHFPFDENKEGNQSSNSPSSFWPMTGVIDDWSRELQPHLQLALSSPTALGPDPASQHTRDCQPGEAHSGPESQPNPIDRGRLLSGPRES